MLPPQVKGKINRQLDHWQKRLPQLRTADQIRELAGVKKLKVLI